MMSIFDWVLSSATNVNWRLSLTVVSSGKSINIDTNYWSSHLLHSQPLTCTVSLMSSIHWVFSARVAAATIRALLPS